MVSENSDDTSRIPLSVCIPETDACGPDKVYLGTLTCWSNIICTEGRLQHVFSWQNSSWSYHIWRYILHTYKFTTPASFTFTQPEHFRVRHNSFGILETGTIKQQKFVSLKLCLKTKLCNTDLISLLCEKSDPMLVLAESLSSHPSRLSTGCLLGVDL